MSNDLISLAKQPLEYMADILWVLINADTTKYCSDRVTVSQRLFDIIAGLPGSTPFVETYDTLYSFSDSTVSYSTSCIHYVLHGRVKYILGVGDENVLWFNLIEKN